MSRKLLSVLLAIAMVFCMFALAACADEESTGGDQTSGNQEGQGAANEDIKIGVILLGDENEGYTAAHIDGIEAAADALNLSDDQIVWRYNIP